MRNEKALLNKCFYGKHLLCGNNKEVLIFESEATAILATPFFPHSLCLATGGKHGIGFNHPEKWNVLKDRSIVLYPDLDAYEIWESGARKLKQLGFKITVSQILKSKAISFSNGDSEVYMELVRQKFDLRDILKYKQI